jgi:hypothetical protein
MQIKANLKHVKPWMNQIHNTHHDLDLKIIIINIVFKVIYVHSMIFKINEHVHFE